MWPLPRHYILYSLKPHTHEDIPFRWFQLLVECDEPSATDRILEEVLVHGDDPDYREDLLALVQLLDQAGDPETEDKILQVLNSDDTPRSAVALLEQFLKTTETQDTRKHDKIHGRSWNALTRQTGAISRPRDCSTPEKSRAKLAIEELLKEDPQYPFALMLKACFEVAWT